MTRPTRPPRGTPGGLLWLPAEAIAPQAIPLRCTADDPELPALAGSIARFGLLHPLTVRRRAGGFELIAGARRLQAAALAGLRELPCLALEADLEQAALLALTENLHRRTPARNELTESADTLSRLFARDAAQLAAQLSCPAAESLLRPPPARRTLFVLKDVRAFVNTVRRGVALLHRGGIRAQLHTQQNADGLCLTVHIPRCSHCADKDMHPEDICAFVTEDDAPAPLFSAPVPH